MLPAYALAFVGGRPARTNEMLSTRVHRFAQSLFVFANDDGTPHLDANRGERSQTRTGRHRSSSTTSSTGTAKNLRVCSAQMVTRSNVKVGNSSTSLIHERSTRQDKRPPRHPLRRTWPTQRFVDDQFPGLALKIGRCALCCSPGRRRKCSNKEWTRLDPTVARIAMTSSRRTRTATWRRSRATGTYLAASRCDLQAEATHGRARSRPCCVRSSYFGPGAAKSRRHRCVLDPLTQNCNPLSTPAAWRVDLDLDRDEPARLGQARRCGRWPGTARDATSARS